MILTFNSNLEWEVIIVDDGSPDGTLEIAKQLQKVWGPEHIILKPRAGNLGLVHGRKNIESSDGLASQPGR